MMRSNRTLCRALLCLGLATPVGAAQEQVVAVVNGVPVSIEELDARIAVSLARIEADSFAMRAQELKRLIEERVLGAEAKRRGVALEELVSEASRGVSEDAVSQFVALNRERIPAGWGQDEPQLREQVRRYLREQESVATKRRLVETLAGKSNVVITLPPPRRRVDVSLPRDWPKRGPKDAPIVVIEVGSYVCPYCRRLQSGLSRLLKEPDVQLAFVDITPRSSKPEWATEVFIDCVGEQGKRWEAHDALYATTVTTAVTTDAMKALTSTLQLDDERVRVCMDASPDKREGRRIAESLGITSTPVVFINGRVFHGAQSAEELLQAVAIERGRLGSSK